MPDAHANFAQSTVATAPSPATSGTSLVVAAGEGTKFPAVPFNAAVWPAATVPTTANAEIVRVTARSTDTLTITRAQESSNARTIIVGDQIAATITAKTLTDVETDLASASAQSSLQAAQIAARATADGGYYVIAGCALAPGSASTTKLDMALGYASAGTVELIVAAQSAISTTIASLAAAANAGGGLTSGQSVWVAVELDAAQVVQFNAGAAATSPAFPTPTASRIPLGWLWIPFGATTVDIALTTSNGNAKLIDARVVRPVKNDWNYDSRTWVYVSATSFKVVGVDATAQLIPGTKVSFDDGTNVPGYGIIGSSVFSTDTTITLFTTTDFPLANHAIVRPRYSYAANPVGWPTWFNWTPTFTGFSADPATGVYKWATEGRKCFIVLSQPNAGTSNNVNHTMTLPFAAATNTGLTWGAPCRSIDNGAAATTGYITVASAGTSAGLCGKIDTLNNTNTGSSRIPQGEFWYGF